MSVKTAMAYRGVEKEGDEWIMLSIAKHAENPYARRTTKSVPPSPFRDHSTRR
jgi:hypothetical protein